MRADEGEDEGGMRARVYVCVECRCIMTVALSFPGEKCNKVYLCQDRLYVDEVGAEGWGDVSPYRGQNANVRVRLYLHVPA